VEVAAAVEVAVASAAEPLGCGAGRNVAPVALGASLLNPMTSWGSSDETTTGSPASVGCTVRVRGAGPEAAVSFPVPAGLPVLHAMIRRALRVLPVGCRGGGCGVCRVQVLEGSYQTLRMSRRQVSEAEAQTGMALACRLLPSTDITVEWCPHPTAPGASSIPATASISPVYPIQQT
jgi:ferredoxin